MRARNVVPRTVDFQDDDCSTWIRVVCIRWQYDDFHGLSIPLNSFRSVVVSNIEHAQKLLWRALMWTSDLAQRFIIDLDILEDDLPFPRRGWLFLNSDSNQLENGYDWMAVKGSIQRGKRRLLCVNGTWQLRAVRRWLKQAT
ncbi:hypothetical protein LTR96_011168 [Exophiala xenobiotica]|nr:hypothetical protein LTR72_011539 [Exophiala xenobiotica]KAK5263430.1 hypothetical protein LTR96_011168 [Exophiala xenobiotica]KAK5285129.1 hypothetical protein LTR14_011217 [Exophiala xenobiotica]KAK5332554.1 hypothetical protein LTR98_011315 [Exophiala xenobiotica]KAK5468960.1 hypothetical protein LTR55_011503 [Exophiala xenobiotica]